MPVETFLDGQSWWQTVSREMEENERFKWERVTAKWCGYGPQPLWPNEIRTFLRNRVRK